MAAGAKAGRIGTLFGLRLLLCGILPAAEMTLSLEEAAARVAPDFRPLNEGRSVVVSGQVSIRPITITKYVHVAIQERGRGLILETTDSSFDRLAPGDWVEAHGRITERWGLAVVAVSRIATVSSGAPPLPVELRPAQAQSIDRVGQLAVVEGPVIEFGSNFGGAYLRIGARSDTIKVFLPSGPTGRRNFNGLAPGDAVRVTGIAYQYCPNPPYTDQF